MKYEEKKVLKAIEGSGGIKTNIANKLGIARNTLDQWIKEHKCLQEAINIESERVLDTAETYIIKGIEVGDMSLIRWYMTLKGSNRGYVPKQEIATSVVPEFPYKVINAVNPTSKTRGSTKANKGT